jgi:predicted butyrate kinase (DUF1464 family)
MAISSGSIVDAIGGGAGLLAVREVGGFLDSNLAIS